eukprot:m.105545 g.105545  ORF g.105545 m.105545 type:complete len:396 (-) comp27658_c0_seq1:463-1650(-)
MYCISKAVVVFGALAYSVLGTKIDDPYPNCTGGVRQHEYTVSVTARDPLADDKAFISHINGSSDFNYNFATAWFPPVPGTADGYEDGLIVRVVECNPNHHSCASAAHQEWSNAGALTVVAANVTASGTTMTSKHITVKDVTWGGGPSPPHANTSKWGAADPRIVYREEDKTYYMTWDNCTLNCYPQRKTYLSTTLNPFNPDGWTLHGQVFPFPYTSGASLLFRGGTDADPHLAFVCNSNTANQILLAESTNGLNWTLPKDPSKSVFMAGRPDCWDKNGVASGAQPTKLSNGDYLYIYNIDTGFPYHPNPLGRCAIGWAILDKNDPTQIVARSNGPLLVATLPWETCPEGKGYECQEPEVVFTTGLKPLGNDEFVILYGAADTDVGVARIKVNINN